MRRRKFTRRHIVQISDPLRVPLILDVSVINLMPDPFPQCYKVHYTGEDLREPGDREQEWAGYLGRESVFLIAGSSGAVQ